MRIPPLSQDEATPRSQPSFEGHVTKDNVPKAKTLWTLKLITSHYSFNSSKDTSQLFSAIFPDSQFACGERKVAYCCIFGSAEQFKKLLQDRSVDLFFVLFDESLNTKMQEKQMDVYVSNSGMIKPTKPEQDISTVNFLVSVESFIIGKILFLLLPFVLMLMKELMTNFIVYLINKLNLSN